MRKNQPFKNRLSELLDRYKLTYRWDLLHLSNRAHIAARGSTKYEQKKASENAADLEEIEDDECNKSENTSSTGISELIDSIQHLSKKNRTGITYTGIQISAINFKRPKIWSCTRMCLYEYDMTLRFLENKVYFEVI